MTKFEEELRKIAEDAQISYDKMFILEQSRELAPIIFDHCVSAAKRGEFSYLYESLLKLPVGSIAAATATSLLNEEMRRYFHEKGIENVGVGRRLYDELNGEWVRTAGEGEPQFERDLYYYVYVWWK